MREGFRGPLFVQGDHCQANAKKYAADPDGEIGAVKGLITEEVAAGFYNIDVDTSTLVDLSQPNLDLQQRTNYERAAEIAAHIRSLEPAAHGHLGLDEEVDALIDAAQNGCPGEARQWLQRIVPEYQPDGPATRPAEPAITIQATSVVKEDYAPDGLKRIDYVSGVDGRSDWALVLPGKEPTWIVCIHGHGSTGNLVRVASAPHIISSNHQ